jgi:3',5'-cyclic AMP phosphodiesterase CpdA
MRCATVSHWLKFPLILLALMFLAGAVLGQKPGVLPAQDWNRANLARITPPPGKPLSFAVFGDCRGGGPVFESLLRQIDQDPDLAFAMVLGDLVDESDLEDYRTFFRQVRANLGLPLLAAPGNHELKGQGLGLYRAIFGPAYYAFQLQDHYFIMVNDADYKKGLDPSQRRWLEEELQKSQAAASRLVCLHIPLFDPREGYQHCLPEELGLPLARLFKQYRVTHIFAGHIHGYFTGQWLGIPYTVSGGGGARLNGTDPEHYFFHFLKVTVSGDQVRVQVRRVRGLRAEKARPLFSRSPFPFLPRLTLAPRAGAGQNSP